MAAVIVLLECSEKGPKGSALSAVSAARLLAAHHGGPVIGVLIGSGLSAASAAAAAYVDKVLAYDKPELAAVLAETWAPVLANAIQKTGASALVGTATSAGKDILPRAAGLLGAGMASDTIAVLSAKTFRRPMYAGNALAEVEVGSPVVVVSVRQSAFAPATVAAAPGAVETADAGAVATLGSEILSISATTSARPDLADAKIVVSGGRGMKAGENFKILEELTDLLGGALGASRAACDSGMVPNDLQVGQTGKVVAPNLYIAVAISGAIQHLAGMKGSKVIVAINKDPEAPIFQAADYGLVATWETAIPALIAQIKRIRSTG